jgi:hypothetical protein
MSSRVPPTWPGDAGKHTVLSDVIVELPLDSLFLLFQGGWNDFREKLEKLNGHADYRSTGWVAPPCPTADLAPTSRPVIRSMSALKPGMVRKTTFLSGKYATTEYGKLLEVDSKRVVVETYVETKAPYGDRFQVMVQSIFEVDGKEKKATRFTVKCAIVYTGSINGMIKGMIEKGSREGMEKGNRNGIQLMKERAKVTPAGAAEGGMGGMLPASAQRTIIYKEHLELLFGKRIIAVFEPYTFLASDILQQMHPSLAVLTPTRIGIICLTVVSLQAVHLLLEVLNMLEMGSQKYSRGRGFMGYGLKLFFRVFHTPHGVHEVLCNFLLLLVVRAIFGLLSLGLPDPRAGDGEYGTKYSGYKAAIANAEPQYVGINAKSEFALEQIGKGLDYFATKFKSKVSSSAEHRQHRREKIKEKLKTHRMHHKTKRHANSPDTHQGGSLSDASSDHGYYYNDEDGHESPEASSGSSVINEVDVFLPALNESVEYSAPSLPPERTVVEEIFECQRHQPFRGWGSKWPGHFLPTDQLNRWNVRTAKSNGLYTSQSLKDVVPDLPQGWKWVEKEWSLDLSGNVSGSTDANGWSYALDFSRDVCFPFPPGSGRAKMSHFVRTRRWLRTRVLKDPEEDAEEVETNASGQKGADQIDKEDIRVADGGHPQTGSSPSTHPVNTNAKIDSCCSEKIAEVSSAPKVARKDASTSIVHDLQQHDSVFFTSSQGM